MLSPAQSRKQETMRHRLRNGCGEDLHTKYQRAYVDLMRISVTEQRDHNTVTSMYLKEERDYWRSISVGQYHIIDSLKSISRRLQEPFWKRLFR